MKEGGYLTSTIRKTLYEFVDDAAEVVAEYRDINPCAETLIKLRSGKIRRAKGRKYVCLSLD